MPQSYPHHTSLPHRHPSIEERRARGERQAAQRLATWPTDGRRRRIGRFGVSWTQGRDGVFWGPKSDESVDARFGEDAPIFRASNQRGEHRYVLLYPEAQMPRHIQPRARRQMPPQLRIVAREEASRR